MINGKKRYFFFSATNAATAVSFDCFFFDLRSVLILRHIGTRSASSFTGFLALNFRVLRGPRVSIFAAILVRHLPIPLSGEVLNIDRVGRIARGGRLHHVDDAVLPLAFPGGELASVLNSEHRFLGGIFGDLLEIRE
jgi:hypothetical protein